MKAVFLWLLVLSCLSYTKALGWHSPTHVFDSNAETDPGGHRKDFEDKMTQLWDKHTIASDDIDTSFNVRIDGTRQTITGKTMLTNLEQKVIYAFQGFRYAKAPNPSTKFKPPHPEDYPHWEGNSFDATSIGFKCPQHSMIGDSISGRTDCLYLNVYTPYLPTSDEMNAVGGMPVMFFVHGGAFTSGDASMYLPTKLLEFPVILVTIHYRLGAQGFFTLNSKEAPGNTALYDQLEALRWTRDHIADFGGDPNQVTIFGESAGSVSVNYLMISPLASDLFHGVIAESGSALDYWAIDYDPEYAANFVMNEVGCNDTNIVTNEDKLNCMIGISEEDIVHAQSALVSHDRKNGLTGFRGCAPIIQQEEDVIDTPPFITREPLEILMHGDYPKVPFMTGANRDEGSFVVGIMYGSFLQALHLTDSPVYMREQMVQQILLSLGVDDKTRAIEESLTNFYCVDNDLAVLADSSSCLIDMVGALFLKAGSWQTCNLHSRHAGADSTFYYSFEFESTDTMYLWLLGNVTWETGITHSDEMMYIFSMPATMEGAQRLTEQRMCLMWTNFAIYGHPTPQEDKAWADEPYNLPEWKSYDANKPHYMIIDDEWVNGNEYSDYWAIDAGKSGSSHMTSTTESETITTEEGETISTAEGQTISTAEGQTISTTEGETMTTEEGGTISTAEGQTISTTEDSMTMTTNKGTGSVCYTEDQYNDLKSERDAFMATMIVFIVFFVIVTGGCIYLFMKR